MNSIGLDKLLDQLTRGLGNRYAKGRLPNFISLDFINEGDGMSRVNKINSIDGEKRRSSFGVIR